MGNRKISLKEYFDCLQREYIVAVIRGQIYPFKKDQDYYNNREVPKKKQSIIEISSRNNFPNIFNDYPTFLKYKSEIYNEWGLPNFVYRCEEDRQQRRPKDIMNYFQKGVSVNIKQENGLVEKGIVVYTHLDKNLVTVNVQEKNIDFPYEKLGRSLKIEI